MRRAYKDIIQVCVPEGTSRVIAELATREHISVSAYIRRLTLRELERRACLPRQNDQNFNHTQAA